MADSPPSKRRRANQQSGEDGSAHESSLSPLVVFAHGAGAPSTSDWMIRSASSLSLDCAFGEESQAVGLFWLLVDDC